MKRYRGISFFLAALAIFTSLNIAYLYHSFYEDADLLVRKHYSQADEENLLTFIKKNPRIPYSPGIAVHHFVFSLPEVVFLPSYSYVGSDSLPPVLRC
jgi:hypothetical protein